MKKPRDDDCVLHKIHQTLITILFSFNSHYLVRNMNRVLYCILVVQYQQIYRQIGTGVTRLKRVKKKYQGQRFAMTYKFYDL